MNSYFLNSAAQPGTRVGASSRDRLSSRIVQVQFFGPARAPGRNQGLDWLDRLRNGSGMGDNGNGATSQLMLQFPCRPLIRIMHDW